MIEQLRASKITIDLPKPGSEPWVQVIVQKVLRDNTYEVKNIIPRYDRISIPLSSVVGTSYPVDTNSDSIITGAEIFNAIYTFVVSLMITKHGGTLNDKRDLIL